MVAQIASQVVFFFMVWMILHSRAKIVRMMENQLHVQASMDEESRCPHDILTYREWLHDNMVHNLT